MYNTLKRHPILNITLILIGGFFGSYFIFDLLGGNDDMKEYFGWQSWAAMGFVLLTFASAIFYFRWYNRIGKKNESSQGNTI